LLKGKRLEFADMLEPLGVQVDSASDHNLPEPEETGTSFEENALLKARAAAQATGLPSLADDSGLCVVDLDNAPGLYSARWAGPEKDFSRAMQKVQQALEDKNSTRRDCFFICTLALVFPDGAEYCFEGRVDGQIVWPPRQGETGFGYDPIFEPLEQPASSVQKGRQTFAEMTKEEKHALSHRSRAVAKFRSALK